MNRQVSRVLADFLRFKELCFLRKTVFLVEFFREARYDKQRKRKKAGAP